LVALVAVAGTESEVAAQVVPSVERFSANPIIVPDLLPGDDGENINGPSLIRVPDWVDNPLGRYYLYFAHHAGSYIRLAYADDLQGPWHIYEPGTLHIEDTTCHDIDETFWADYRHVASPDVQIDEESRTIRLYFHCPTYIDGSRSQEDSYQQVTLVATSLDGLSFEADSEPLGKSYFRVFQWNGEQYALGMPGVFYRSKDGLTAFEEGPTLFTEDMRHTAVRVVDDRLIVLYTVVGENPERILMSEIELSPDWTTWAATEPKVVLEPELSWEGGDLASEPSVRGYIMTPVRQLRDPALFEEDGRSFLLYAVAGEDGIAIAELRWP